MEKKTQLIHRKGNFDSGHRVMNERMKCYNIHGHTYLFDLSFSFEAMEDIGYAIDFKEIKRVSLQWVDDLLDHGMILNAHDTLLIDTTKAYGTKLWLMSLNGEGEYCNPSVENIAREVFLAQEIICEILYPDKSVALTPYQVTIYETPNCWTDCFSYSIPDSQRANFRAARYEEIKAYALEKGVIEYDDRKASSCNL